jgi:hypothetical protein
MTKSMPISESDGRSTSDRGFIKVGQEGSRKSMNGLGRQRSDKSRTKFFIKLEEIGDKATVRHKPEKSLCILSQ